MNQDDSRTSEVKYLRALLQQRGSQKHVDVAERCCASAAFDLSPGEVSEWIAAQAGSGAAELALSAIRKRLTPHAHCLIIDSVGDLYSPALEQRGLNLSRIVFVKAKEPTELFWAAEQGLRSRGVDVVWCRLSRLTSVAFRRLKLAAEAGGAICLLMRGPEALRDTSWADVRLLISGLPSTSWSRRRMRVEVLKLRNGSPGAVFQMELDDETDTVRVVSELADSTSLPRAAPA